jgi:uracil-DNA glycosylase
MAEATVATVALVEVPPVKKLLSIGRKPVETLSLVELANYSTDFSWRGVFDEAKLEIDRIEQILYKVQCEYTGYKLPPASWLFVPKRKDLFRVFRETVMSNVKAIIIGMDPYPGFYPDGTPFACGIAFSAEHAIPKSLDNIFAEVKRCYPSFIKPKTGDLTPWCKQGVLLINASLTHLPNNDSKTKTQKEVWLPLVYRLLGEVTTCRKHLAICLWGRDAQSYDKHINGAHLILTSSHPSPLSAAKGDEPFNDSRHFSKINDHLEKHGITPIDWNLV